MAGSQLVVGALACQERPASTDAGSIEWRTIGVLTVAIVIVAMPDRPVGRFNFKQGVHHFDRIQDPRIIRSTQPEANQGQGIRTHDRVGWMLALSPWPVLDRDRTS